MFAGTCGVAARVRLAEPILVDSSDPEQELELVPQVRPHHLRAVRRDRERHLVLRERANVIAHGVLVGERLGEEFEVGRISSVIPWPRSTP